MAKSVKIRNLVAPSGDLSVFDPGAYLANLEFYESDDVISEVDRDGLAQFVHFLAFLALSNQSTGWPDSVVPRSSTAFRALQSHFSQLENWPSAVTDPGIPYRALASLLMAPYPPKRPEA